MTDQAKNRGWFKKGDPSPNPQGRGASIAKAKAAPGYDGVQASSGYIHTGENDSRLRGSTRWKTFANLYRTCPPVPIWARLRDRLLSGITWTLQPNPAGGKDAERGVEVATEALINVRLGSGAATRPWSKVAARAMNGAAATGFSIHALAFGRRKRDGLIVYADIAHRPQQTIDQWFRERNDDMSPFVRVVQRGPSGGSVPLDLRDCLYIVNDNGTNSEAPTGVGMLDLIAERARQLGVYETIIGTELASSMGGVPIARVPLQEMAAELKTAFKGKSGSELLAAVVSALAAKTLPIRDFLAKRFKDPTTLQWLELDSITYQGTDPNTITGTPKWGVEIVKGELQGVTESHPIAREFILDIARMLGVEHVFVGGGDTTGTYGMHESKISALGADLSAEARLFAAVADDQVVRPIIAANGLDPDVAAPYLVPSPIMRADVLKAVQAIAQLNMAGLAMNHPAKRAVFEGVDLPWQDEDEPMLPRGFGGFPPRSLLGEGRADEATEDEKEPEAVPDADRETEEEPEAVKP